jgi:hypothetical protein
MVNVKELLDGSPFPFSPAPTPSAAAHPGAAVLVVLRRGRRVHVLERARRHDHRLRLQLPDARLAEPHRALRAPRLPRALSPQPAPLTARAPLWAVRVRMIAQLRAPRRHRRPLLRRLPRPPLQRRRLLLYRYIIQPLVELYGVCMAVLKVS